jgi:hypothetical protein
MGMRSYYHRQTVLFFDESLELAGADYDDIALNCAPQLPMVAVHDRFGDQRFFEFVHQ